uniref:PDZ domain-containing protein n=1 Tax=Parastrongyloides trichosuri TaxID=131310 RepID=A0A0N4ZR13_PARTI
MSVFYPSLEDMSVDQYIVSCGYSSQPSAPTYYHAYNRENDTNNVSVVPIYESVNNMERVKETGKNSNQKSLMQFDASKFHTDVYQQQDGNNDRKDNSRVMIRNENSSIILNDNRRNNDTTEQLPNGALMVAPISLLSSSLSRSVVHHGVRTTTLYKEEKGKIGLRLRLINMGMFVQFVAEDSPAAIGGIRFGDQILQINGNELLGLTEMEAMDLLNSSNKEETVDLVIRDRPFERSVTLHKDNLGNLGFAYSDNKITHIIKNSSASRNGLLINQRILEINGQNVIGFKSPQVKKILEEAEQTVTLTIISNEMYNELLKNVSWSLILKKQDHSMPE